MSNTYEEPVVSHLETAKPYPYENNTTQEAPLAKPPKPAVNEGFALFYFFWIGGIPWCCWNGFLSCLEFFKSKFGEDSGFIYPLAIYPASFLIAVVISNISNTISYNTRVVGSLLVLITLGAIIPFEAELYQDTTFGLLIMMLLLFILGFFTNLCYGSISGLASQIEGKFTAYFLIGSGVFALLMNLLKLGLNAILGNPPIEDIVPVLIYFGVIEGLMVISLFIHFAFMRSTFARARFENKRNSIWDDEMVTPMIQAEKAPAKPRDIYTMINALKQTWPEMLLLILSYFQQNLGYPALMMKKPIPWMDAQDKNILFITTLSVAAIVGKKLGQFRNYYNRRTVIIVTLVRCFVIVAFLIQALTNQVPILNWWIFGFFNIALHGLTIGFNNVALFILGPERVADDDKEIVGFLSVIIMNTGNMIGSFTALPLKNIGYTKNEF